MQQLTRGQLEAIEKLNRPFMTTGQYRALVGWLHVWPKTGMSFSDGLRDIGITLSEEDATQVLWRAGWTWNAEKLEITYSNA